MPTTKSAAKRIRTSARKHLDNRAAKTKVATMRRKLDEAIAAGDKDAAEKAFGPLCSALDKAVKKGALKANTASRGKSRAAARINAL